MRRRSRAPGGTGRKPMVHADERQASATDGYADQRLRAVLSIRKLRFVWPTATSLRAANARASGG